jgi:hypothetical protein
MNWIKVPNSQFIRILEKCPDRVSNQGSIGYTCLLADSRTLQRYRNFFKLFYWTCLKMCVYKASRYKSEALHVWSQRCNLLNPRGVATVYHKCSLIVSRHATGVVAIPCTVHCFSNYKIQMLLTMKFKGVNRLFTLIIYYERLKLPT